ncbi:MAG: hypothetical protein Q4Q58_02525 [Thermoplasmata archaeon]|nr:hypothetical protein [Thermoplasmata archaeon]
MSLIGAKYFSVRRYYTALILTTITSMFAGEVAVAVFCRIDPALCLTAGLVCGIAVATSIIWLGGHTIRGYMEAPNARTRHR